MTSFSAQKIYRAEINTHVCMSSKLFRKEHICKREKLLETYRLILDDIEQTFLHIYTHISFRKKMIFINLEFVSTFFQIHSSVSIE